MKDITLRERLQIWKKENEEKAMSCKSEEEADNLFLAFIESEISNARKEWAEEIKTKAIEIVNTHSRLWVNHAKVQTDFALIKASIQSLN